MQVPILITYSVRNMRSSCITHKFCSVYHFYPYFQLSPKTLPFKMIQVAHPLMITIMITMTRKKLHLKKIKEKAKKLYVHHSIHNLQQKLNISKYQPNIPFDCHAEWTVLVRNMFCYVNVFQIDVILYHFYAFDWINLFL